MSSANGPLAITRPTACITIAHWVCKDGQPWKVGIGLFLGRGPAKPKDLEIKLASMEAEPP